MRRTETLIWLVTLVATAALSTAGVSTPAAAQSVSGELLTRYRDRWGSDSYEDEDLYGYLRLSIWDDSRERTLGGAVSLRYDYDLLARANEIDEDRDDLRVYYAYVDVNKIERFDLRLGRMIVDEAEGFHITGIKGVYEAPWKRLRIGVFGGEPVSYYESIGDDWTAGATFSMKPDSRSQLRGSWIHVDEATPDVDATTREDDVATLSYRAASPAGWNVWATVRTLNFDVWNEFLGGTYRIAPISLNVTGTYRRQEDTNSSSSRYYYGHLSSILGASLPYHRFTLSLNRPFGDAFALGAGGERRELLDDDENRANQEYTRFFFDVFVLERLLWGFEANANFSRWYTERDDNSTVAGSVSRRIGDKLSFDLGTYYAKYEVRRLFDLPDELPVERYDVRSYYLRGDWRVRRKYRVQVELERGTDSTSPDAFYQLELRFGLDLGFLGREDEP